MKECAQLLKQKILDYARTLVPGNVDRLELEDVRKAISEAAGCKLKDDTEKNIYPMPIETSDQDLVYVGRIRRDLVCENGINLWCCGDQVRKGAATNAVQIAQLLISRD